MMIHKEPFIAPDAVPSRRPMQVEAAFSVENAIAARHALNLFRGDRPHGYSDVDVIKDFLSMLVDAAHQNDGSFVAINAKVM